MEIIKALNLGVRFLLELAILAAVGNWGFATQSVGWRQVALGIGVPALIAVLWGMLGSPKAIYPLTGAALVIFELLIFGAAPVALFATDHALLAWSFVLIYLVNKVLLVLWQQ